MRSDLGLTKLQSDIQVKNISIMPGPCLQVDGTLILTQGTGCLKPMALFSLGW